MDVLDYLAAHHEPILRELVEFVGIASVSADPSYKLQLAQAATWVADQLREAGPFSVQVMPTAGHPIVYAEWLGAAGAPTILVYGHYDVQPPDPLNQWLSPPFEPSIREGRLYGRGVSDDKGPMFIPIKVAQGFFATRGHLPLNVKFLIEGEEEIGSPSLESFIEQHRELLAADFVLSADGAMWRTNEPSITVSSRGIVGLEFSLTGASKDLHSGRYGGSVPNALHAMAELVASLHADGRVAVAGFYDDVEELPADEREAIRRLPFDAQAFLRELGVVEDVGEPGYTTLERQWIRPTLEVNGLWGGYQGPGSKTVTPHTAHAKITCRLVPNQTPERVLARLVAHLEKGLPRGTRLSITDDHHRANPYRIPTDHPGLRIAQSVLQDVYEQAPLMVRMGGTLPVSDLFKRFLKADTVFFSFSTADEDFHAPNEFFRLHRLQEGLKAWALYWQHAGQGDVR